MTHRPLTQLTLPGSTSGSSAQSVPHAPQFAVLFCTSVQTPSHDTSVGPLHALAPPAPPAAAPPTPPVPPTDVDAPDPVEVVLPESPQAEASIPVAAITIQGLAQKTRTFLIFIRAS